MSKSEYIKKNQEWLQEKSLEEGVVHLPKDIHYKVLSTGDPSGSTPQLSDIIFVHYTGRTIDGKVFDTSRSGMPLVIRLRELIEGWQIALTRMHVGDRWELYIPADMGYGKSSLPGIPGGSTLIFDVELIKIQ